MEEQRQWPDWIAFDWDEGNKNKNKILHHVEWWECEQIFSNYPLFHYPDEKHSKTEVRRYAFGRTDANRLLTIVFTIRQDRVRIISARGMNKRERRMYHEKIAALSIGR